MSSNLVIVAIPDHDDRVWKISSEKIPHLTLLSLGDAGQVSNLDQIMLFVEHAASTSLKRFYLPVDHRGELGEDKADVLFFKKGRYDFAAVRDFRSLLLKDTNIKSAYDATQQFEAPKTTGQAGQPWIPHLTLGYPSSPAKPFPDGDIANFYDVNFDRIAVWTGDFEGPEFRLKDYWDDWDEMPAIPMDVAMSDLQHHGVKGQKWGVRKEDTASGGHIRISEKNNRAGISTENTVALVSLALIMPPLLPLAFISPRLRAEVGAANAHNKNVKADQKWKKQLQSAEKAVEVHNKAADEVNKKIPDFNSDKRWKNADGTDIHLPSNPAKKQEYDRAAESELLNPAYARASIAVHGSTSPGGRYKFSIEDHATATLKVTDLLEEKRATIHAATDDEVTVHFKILRDKNGHILGFKPDESEAAMAQAMELGQEFLEHFGVKGMKWGVRKETDAQTYLRIGDTPQDRKDARRDARWLKKNHGVDITAGPYMPKSDRKIFGAAQKTLKPEVKALNKSPEFSGKENRKQLKDPTSALSDRYDKAHTELFAKHMKAAVEKHGKTSPSGKWEEKVRVGKDGSWYVGIKKTGQPVRHTAMTDMDYEFFVQPVRDADRLIVDYQMLEIVEDASMAQTSELGEEFLEHFGVKGMHWGVRKIKAGAKAVGRGLAALGARLADSSWQSSTYSDLKHEAVHNHVAEKLDNRVERLQRSPKYRGKDLKADRALRHEYHQDVAKVSNAAYRTAVKETYGENYTGTKTAHFVKDVRGARIEVRNKKTGETEAEAPLSSMKEIKKRRKADAEAFGLGHADISDAPDLVIELKEDANEQIIGVGFVKPSDETLAQSSADLGAEFVLEHFGVKGMHWGQRKSPPTAVSTSSTSVVPHGTKRKTKIQVEGGENHPAHDDAIRVAEAKAKLKKSGTSALSNQELREMANRLQLENQVAILTSSKGKQFVSREFETTSKQLVKRGTKKGVKRYGPTVAKKAGKAAATAATIAVL